MKYAFIFICILTIGCVYQTEDITDIIKAQQFCADKGGLKKIDISFGGFEEAYCINGMTNGDLNGYKLNNDPPN